MRDRDCPEKQVSSIRKLTRLQPRARAHIVLLPSLRHLRLEEHLGLKENFYMAAARDNNHHTFVEHRQTSDFRFGGRCLSETASAKDVLRHPWSQHPAPVLRAMTVTPSPPLRTPRMHFYRTQIDQTNGLCMNSRRTYVDVLEHAPRQDINCQKNLD